MIGKVVILGRDAAGWLSALALHRALGPAGLDIQVIELPSLLRDADIYPTLPAIEAFHRLLGIDEHDLLKHTARPFTLGQSFVNFSGPRPPFFHAYGSYGVALAQVPFFQILTRARQGGLTVPFEDFSLTAAAAKQNRFVVPDSDTENFARTDYGYHLPAQAYVAYLKSRAAKAGIAIIPARAAAVERDAHTGDILALQVGDQRIAGDLFIDAGGAEGALIRQIGQPFESWRPWFGGDRTLSVSGERLKSLPPYAQVRAQSASWLGLYAAQTATHLIQVYNSRFLSDDDALQTAAVVSGLSLSDAVVNPIEPGCTAAAWAGNCVAIGEAACTFDPIDNVGLQGVQTGLVHLLALFPRTRDMAGEREEYNRLTGMAYARLRDFQLAHYVCNRLDSTFWDRARGVPVPESLQAKLDGFKARGFVPLYDEEGFHADSWHAILNGHGLEPQSYEPLVDAIPDADIAGHLRRVLGISAARSRPCPRTTPISKFSAVDRRFP
ncbi:MAG: tryptophan 7-halogenase [Asticcacaulis sp.]